MENETNTSVEQDQTGSKPASLALAKADSLFPSHEDMVASLKKESNESFNNSQTQQKAEISENLSSHDVEFEKISRENANQETKEADSYENKFQKSEPTEKEKEALSKGWKEKDKYEGNPADWVSASEFLVRGRMIDQMNDYKHQMSKLNKSNEALLGLVRKQSERLSKTTADEILEKKREAITEGDVEKAEEYEGKYNEIKQEVDSFKDLELKRQANSELDGEIQEFVVRNKEWFNTDTPENWAMYKYAEQKDAELMQKYPQWPTKTRLEEVEKTVKSFFSDKFENKARYKPGLVEASHKPAVRDPAKLGYNEMPPEVKKVIDNFMHDIAPMNRKAKNPITKDQYAQQLLMTGAVKYD